MAPDALHGSAMFIHVLDHWRNDGWRLDVLVKSFTAYLIREYRHFSPLLGMWSAIAQGTSWDAAASSRHRKGKKLLSLTLSRSESGKEFATNMKEMAVMSMSRIRVGVTFTSFQVCRCDEC